MSSQRLALPILPSYEITSFKQHSILIPQPHITLPHLSLTQYHVFAMACMCSVCDANSEEPEAQLPDNTSPSLSPSGL